MKAKIICIEGYWKDDRKPFEQRCVVMPKEATDSMRDAILDDVGKGLFYIFDENERILGEHLDFVVEFYNPVYEIELGAVQ
jgi:hypothetical protein